MRAGRLRFRIEVQEAVETRNTVGEVTQSWECIKKIWAAIDPIRGDEQFTMMQAKPTIDTKITVRSLAARGVTPKHRFVYGDRVFDIDATIDWQSRGIFSEIYCKEHA